MTANQPQSDFAALSASALAAMLAIYSSSGPYDVTGLAVSATLAMVIVAYAGSSTRTAPQSLAFGMVLGLALLPTIGLFWESQAGLTGCEVLNGGHRFVETCTNKNTVTISWFGVTVLLIIIDLLFQRKSNSPPRTDRPIAR